jgi:hypothetical protein
VLLAFGLIVWIGLSVLVAAWARRNGHSFGAYLLIGLLISPAVSLIVLLIVSAIGANRRQPRSAASASTTASYLDELKTLGELRDSGTLSSEEFELEKARILKARA